MDIHPGQRLGITGSDETWRVASVALEHMVVEAQLVRTGTVSVSTAPADPGRSMTQPDLAHGPTVFHLIDLPPLEDGLAAAPRVVVAAAGPLPGWRRAALLQSADGGASWQEAGATALPATMGIATSTLAAGTGLLIDQARTVEIALLNSSMTLGDADELAIRAGGNLAMLGDELIQFRSAQPLGGNVFQLAGLNRGMRGTEWAMTSHVAGERFVLLEADALANIAVSAGVAEVRVIASGLGDDVSPPQQALSYPGQALLPPSPVHHYATRLANGDTEIRWVRRSRDGWRWIDGADAPLGEEIESYQIALTPDVGVARTQQVGLSALTYVNAERVANISNGATAMTISVRQSGLFGLSRPASLTFALT